MYLKILIQFLSHTNHISSTQEPQVPNGYHFGQHRYRTFPTPQEVLLSSVDHIELEP